MLFYSPMEDLTTFNDIKIKKAATEDKEKEDFFLQMDSESESRE